MENLKKDIAQETAIKDLMSELGVEEIEFDMPVLEDDDDGDEW